MKGMNQFNRSRLQERRSSAVALDGVFISYSRRDKDNARKVVKMVEDLGINVYFDENDEALQLADEQKDHEKVVECIENGISHSTALLGIITENTKDSWWVPYEIGSATGHAKPHAHLITKEVDILPSYIQASTILPSVEALDAWLTKHAKSNLSKLEFLLESLGRSARGYHKSASVDPVPMSRSISDLSFY